jgi:hypothetical protein
MNPILRARGRLSVLGLALLAAAGCGDSPSAMLHATTEASAEALAATAEVYTVVRPAVVVQDPSGQPVVGSRVTFEVTAGGGTVEKAAVVTDGAGRAEAQWRLGRAAGENRVLARIGPQQTVTFVVTGVPGPAHRVEVAALPPEVAPVASPVGIAPAVRVTDAHGNGVASVRVEFAATRGGGSVASGDVVTDSDGIAVAAGWSTGLSGGENELTATVAGLAPVRFTTLAVATSSEWLHLTKFAGDATTCPANTAGCQFTVRVLDVTGAPVEGERVLWYGPGGAHGTTVTNRQGLSMSPNLGTRQTGQYTQTARLLSASDDAVFSYRIVSPGGYNIDLRFTTDASPAVRAAFEWARQRWMQVITGNLPEFALTGTNRVAANACGITHPAVDEVVDDLLIFAEIVPIDGPGKVLGSAGPCFLRGGSGLPIMGVIKLDADDLAMMERNGTLRDVILHEIGHVLGIGTLWSRHSLVQGAGTSDPFYTGARAQPGFVLGGGTLFNGVPVENTGGQGTRDGHWRESRLGNELMTGYINTGGNPLSVITVGSLMDIGYQVNFGAADSYLLPGTLGAASVGEQMHLHELPLPAPRVLW